MTHIKHSAHIRYSINDSYNEDNDEEDEETQDVPSTS